VIDRLAQNIADADIVNGSVLLIDKPLRYTSFDVVKAVKRYLQSLHKCKKVKIGHAGTLDPLATGLLILCTGKCTKQIAEIQNQRKIYEGTFTFGATTKSYDLETPPENLTDYSHLSQEDILTAADQLTGTLQQLPPLFSAVHVNGKRAFEYARSGSPVILQPKEVTVYSFKILRMELPEVDFEIVCSKGTYIRSIARDIGEMTGCGAYLSRLRRTKTGSFSVEDALDISSLMTSQQHLRKPRDFELKMVNG
jgi:tRNA pseudouridine55 synthase